MKIVPALVITLIVIFDYIETSDQSDKAESSSSPDFPGSPGGRIIIRLKQTHPGSLSKRLNMTTFCFPAHRPLKQYSDTHGVKPGFYDVPTGIPFSVQYNDEKDVFGFIIRTRKNPDGILKRLYSSNGKMVAINMLGSNIVRELDGGEIRYLEMNPHGFHSVGSAAD